MNALAIKKGTQWYSWNAKQTGSSGQRQFRGFVAPVLRYDRHVWCEEIARGYFECERDDIGIGLLARAVRVD